MQISVRFLKSIRLHRYRLKLCLMLIVCAMFRLGEPRPLRRPLGLSSPTVPLFSRADWGGRSASAPSAAVPALVFSRRSRWAMSASFSSSSCSSVQFQVRRNRQPGRSTKLLRPMVDRSSATSWTRRKRSYVRQCMPFGLSGNSSDMLGLPPSRIRIFCDFPSPR